MRFIDNFLNNITMYRLVLYWTAGLIGIAEILSFFKILPFNPLGLAFCTGFLVFVCYVANKVFSRVFDAQTNVESVYISAFILALVITPIRNFHDLPFLGWLAVWTMASKYIFAIRKKHIFNPVAAGLVVTTLGLEKSASWWVGTAWMLPFVALGAFLIVRKIRRFDMVASFFLVSLATILFFSVLRGSDPFNILKRALTDSPIVFFAAWMLTEPLTTPPVKKLQIIYGAIAGFLFAPLVHIGPFYTTPELALVMGNVYSYVVSPKYKLVLTLKETVKVANGVWDFVFKPDKKVAYLPGQYMEWTLGHKKADARGNRRYFTVASSPTEEDLRLGVKFYEKPSSFKSHLGALGEGGKIVASGLSGDFVLPKDQNKKLVFIAGGIGVTPFRSMVKYLIDRGQKRDIVIIYSNKTAEDIAYKEIFDQAENLGVKTVYTLTDNVPEGWVGRHGFVDEKMIMEEVPDFKQRTFYISGPNAMVKLFQKTLKKMGVRGRQIKTDFFPGFV